MPTTSQIEAAAALTVAQALRLRTLLRASEVYGSNLGLYEDLDTVLQAEIERKFNLSGATNATPIVVTAVGHNFVADDLVSIAGVVGNTAANGQWPVASVSGNNFSLVGSVGNGVYASGGVVTSLKSKQLSALVAALDTLGDGAVGLSGGREGVQYSDVAEREALLAEVLGVLYSLDDLAATEFVGAGQRYGPQRVEIANGSVYKVY